MIYFYSDVKGEGSIDSGDLMKLVKKNLGKDVGYDDILRVCREASSGKDSISIEDYLNVIG